MIRQRYRGDLERQMMELVHKGAEALYLGKLQQAALAENEGAVSFCGVPLLKANAMNYLGSTPPRSESLLEVLQGYCRNVKQVQVCEPNYTNWRIPIIDYEWMEVEYGPAAPMAVRRDVMLELDAVICIGENVWRYGVYQDTAWVSLDTHGAAVLS